MDGNVGLSTTLVQSDLNKYEFDWHEIDVHVPQRLYFNDLIGDDRSPLWLSVQNGRDIQALDVMVNGSITQMFFFLQRGPQAE